MKRRQIKLYNLTFPIWILWAFPITWLIVLPLNFVIDLCVTVLVLKKLNQEHIWSKVKKSVWKTWIFGFIADFAGAAFVFLGVKIDFNNFTLSHWWYLNIGYPLTDAPFETIYSVLWMFIAIGISSVLIYIFNLKICLKNLDLDDNIKRKLALWLAIITAPYFFCINFNI